MKSLVFAIDFDGTIVTHMYPKLGDPVPHAIETMKQLIRHEHKIILYTMRTGFELEHAVEYITKNGIPLYGVNENPQQASWSISRKVYAHYYIDDAALGCPLVQSIGRPYVDWFKVNQMLVSEGVIFNKII